MAALKLVPLSTPSRSVVLERRVHLDVRAGREQVDPWPVRGEGRPCARLVARADGEDVGIGGRVDRRVALLRFVAGGRDHEAAAALRAGDRRLELRVALRGAEAQLDDARARGGGDARRRLDASGRRRHVPDVEPGRGVDADDPDPVRRCGRDRGDLGAVELSRAGHGLGVQVCRRRAPAKSGWLASTPLSTIVRGIPGPGAAVCAAPTAPRNHSFPWRGSAALKAVAAPQRHPRRALRGPERAVCGARREASRGGGSHSPPDSDTNGSRVVAKPLSPQAGGLGEVSPGSRANGPALGHRAVPVSRAVTLGP